MWPGQDGQPADGADASANQGEAPGWSDAPAPGGAAAENAPAGTERPRAALSPSGSVWPETPASQGIRPGSTRSEASWTARHDPLTSRRPRFIPKAELLSSETHAATPGALQGGTDEDAEGAAEPESPAAPAEPGAAFAAASTPVTSAPTYPGATAAVLP